jgi:hypothetical protein
MKKKENLRIITLTRYVVPSTSPGYYLRGLQTFLTLLILPSTCVQVFKWFYLPPATFNVPPLDSFIYNPLLYPLQLLPIAYRNAFQPIGNNLLVYYPLISTTMDLLLPSCGNNSLGLQRLSRN